jgi:hypothetical protein
MIPIIAFMRGILADFFRTEKLISIEFQFAVGQPPLIRLKFAA